MSNIHKINIEPIAAIYNDYNEKFGIPRQSRILENNISTIVFEPKYRDENALRGLENYSHVWLLWLFDKNNSKKDWSPTVRPPRLGGNKRMGVFATRSPYHPNNIGLSCVKIVNIEKTTENGIVLKVAGADLLNKTPILDIKPYLAFTDSIPDAKCGFSDQVLDYELKVNYDIDISEFSEDMLFQITQILKQDPRPSYQCDPDRIYGMTYGTYNIRFRVDKMNLNVISIENTERK